MKYDPKAKYTCVKGRISHKGNGEDYTAGDGKTFDMKHRTPVEVEYLIDVRKVIAPATAKK